MFDTDVTNNQKSHNYILGASSQTPLNLQNFDDKFLVNYNMSKDKYVINLDLEIDGEWSNQLCEGYSKTLPISLQIGDRTGKKIFLEHPQWKENYGESYNPSWTTQTPLPLLLNATETSIIKNEIDNEIYESQEKYLGKGVKKNCVLNLTLYIYYSFKDVEIFLGKKLASSILWHIEQKRRLRTIVKKNGQIHEDFIDLNYYLKIDNHIYKVKLFIVDLCGIAGGKSLLDTSLIYGIPMSQKTLMDTYKTTMNIPYQDSKLRHDFIQYSLGDLVLFNLEKNHLIKHNNIREILELMPVEKVPLTKGSEVAQTFQDFILSKCPLDSELLDHLQTKNAEDFLSENGMKFHLDKDKKTTVIYNAIVHGGRCKNETPQDPIIHGTVLSMDLSGCYANALKHLVYPVGLPLNIFFHKPPEKKKTTKKQRQELLKEYQKNPRNYLQQNQQKTEEEPPYTLRKFLKEFGKELVRDCWHIVVSTIKPLTFKQNLICSKHFNGIPTIDRTKEDMDEGNIKGEFGIYLNEIKNGILTHHSLQMLKAFANNKEWGELLDNLQIISGVIYLKSHQCKTFEEYREKVLASTGHIKTVKRKTRAWYIKDDRPLYWYPQPIGEFINPLIQQRKEAKTLRDQHLKNSDEYNIYNSQQETLKLFINALYGVLASPYFKIGNTTVANNITDMARMGCWGMEIASCGKTSITDGTELNINQVLSRNDKIPSLNTLAKLQLDLMVDESDMKVKQNFQVIPLGNQGNWEIAKDENTNEYVLYREGIEIERKTNNESWAIIDEIYTQHIKDFFRGLDLTWIERYTYEDKGLYLGMVINSQSNYMLITPEEKQKVKARGHNTTKDNLQGNVNGKHPLNDMFFKVYNGEKIPYYKPVKTEQLLKLTEVTNSHIAQEKGVKAELICDYNLLPSDVIHVEKRIYPLSASSFYYLSKKQRTYWETLEQRCQKTTDNLQKLDYLFRDPQGNLDYLQTHKILHDLITVKGVTRDLELKKYYPQIVKFTLL